MKPNIPELEQRRELLTSYKRSAAKALLDFVQDCIRQDRYTRQDRNKINDLLDGLADVAIELRAINPRLQQHLQDKIHLHVQKVREREQQERIERARVGTVVA